MGNGNYNNIPTFAHTILTPWGVGPIGGGMYYGATSSDEYLSLCGTSAQ